MKEIETKRLILRPFKMSDAKDVYDYAKRDDVGPFAGWKPHKNLNETKDIVKGFIEKDEVYALELKDNHKVIGSLGIHYTSIGDLDNIYELGYVLHPLYHRQGIMSEAIDTALYDFFFHKKQDLIYVGHFIENAASKHLIGKFNFEWIKDIDYQSRDYGLKQSKIYQLTKLNYSLNREDIK